MEPKQRILSVLVLAVALAGCAARPTKQEVGAVTGAVVGGDTPNNVDLQRLQAAIGSQ